MTAEMDWTEVFADKYGRDHLVGFSPEFITLIREKVPAEAAIPSVFWVIFHTAASTLMATDLHKNPERGSNWNSILEDVIDRAHKEATPYGSITAFIRMSLAQSVCGKEEWDLAASSTVKLYERMVNDGVLIKTPEGKYKLDSNLQETFGPTIVKKADEWIGSDDIDRFLGNVIADGPIFTPVR